MAKATINDVARLAGVSIKTVSRVVNREPHVRQSTRDKVNKAIARLHYRPYVAARSLASHRSRLIALVYEDPITYEIASAGYVARMQHGALRACRAADHELLIHPCNYRNKNLSSELNALIEQARLDGIVLAAPLSSMPKVVKAITAVGTPLVLLSPGVSDAREFSVSTNDREVSAEMTRYLASLGHRRIGFVTGHQTHKAVANRFLGYQDGLRQSGLTFSERFVAAGDNSFGSGEVCGVRLLKRRTRPTAIFAANDDMAAGVIRAANCLGIDVPRQLSVAGWDDIALARQIYPALTTIRQPLAAMAERAAMSLVDESREYSSLLGTEEVILASVRIRESTGPVPD